MENSPWNLEQIVSEVVRRLQQQTGKPLASHSPRSNALEISDRVISLSTLEGRLAGIRKLVTRKDAVTTPSAKDELRRHRVEIIAGLSGETTNRPTLILSTTHNQYDPEPLKKMLEKTTDRVILHTSKDLPVAIRQMAVELSQPPCLGVFITQLPAVALCLANRDSRLRAVQGFDKQTLRSAARSLGANLLVLHPKNRLLMEMADLLKEFLDVGCLECPAEYREYLN